MSHEELTFDDIYERRRDFIGGFLVEHLCKDGFNGIFSVGKIDVMKWSDDMISITTDSMPLYRTTFDREGWMKPKVFQKPHNRNIYVYDPLLETAWTLVPRTEKSDETDAHEQPHS